MPERLFDGVKDVPNWYDVSPRFGVAYDLFGNGRTAVKGHIGAYVQSEGPGFANTYNPVVFSTDTRSWNDLNGDDIAQENELGPTSNLTFGVRRNRNPDPDITRPRQWVGNAGVQHEVLRGLGLSITYVQRSYRDTIWTDNLAISPTDYTLLTVPDPRGNGQLLPVYSINPAMFGLVNELDTNSGANSRVYRGVDVTFNWRLRGGGTLYGGTSTGRVLEDMCEVEDLNSLRFCNRHEFDIPFRTSFSLAGSWWRSGTRYFYQGYCADCVRRLPALPSAGGLGAVCAADLRGRADSCQRHCVRHEPRVHASVEARARVRRVRGRAAPERRADRAASEQFDSIGSARTLAQQDPAPGYEGLIPHSVRSPDGYFLDWGPGHMPYVAPDGMAWPLDPGTDLVMMLHLRPSGQVETVQATLGLYISDEPPTLTPALIRLTRQDLDIPPGERDYRVGDAFTLEVDVELHTVQPHAHTLAREVKGVAVMPDGTEKPLIYIRDWESDWQGVYRYAHPVFLPAGTTIRMEWAYDNSADNPRKSHTPPRRVTYGQRTDDEMAELWFQAVTPNAAERETLASAMLAKMLRSEITGYERMIHAHPTDSALHDDVALLYVQAGDLARAAEHFAETQRLQPDHRPRTITWAWCC